MNKLTTFSVNLSFQELSAAITALTATRDLSWADADTTDRVLDILVNAFRKETCKILYPNLENP